MYHKSDLQVKAQQLGDMVRRGYTFPRGETREKFAERKGLCPKILGEIVNGKVTESVPGRGYTTLHCRRTMEKVADALTLSTQDREVIFRLIQELTPEGYRRQAAVVQVSSA